MFCVFSTKLSVRANLFRKIICRRNILTFLFGRLSVNFVATVFDPNNDENFSDLAMSLSFPNRFIAWPNFNIDNPIFGDQFICLIAHVLDYYPKSLDPVFDVLRIETL